MEPGYFVAGKFLPVEQKQVRIFHSSAILHDPILDRGIAESEDGNWIDFDRTLRFPGRKKGHGKYRVVIEWSNEFINSSVFAHRYFWVEYGPFDWGEAPPCGQVLKATYRSRVTFDGDRVKVSEPVGEDPEKIKPESEEGGDKMTAVPERVIHHGLHEFPREVFLVSKQDDLQILR